MIMIFRPIKPSRFISTMIIFSYYIIVIVNVLDRGRKELETIKHESHNYFLF